MTKKSKRENLDPKEWDNALLVLDRLGADVAAIVSIVKKKDRHLIIELAKSLEKLKEADPRFWDESGKTSSATIDSINSATP